MKKLSGRRVCARGTGGVLLALLVGCGETPSRADTGAQDARADVAPGADVATGDVAQDAASDDASVAVDARADVAADVPSAVDAGMDVAMDSATDVVVARDAGTDSASVDAARDSGGGTAHVHISISNTCVVSISPTSFTVPAGETLLISYHNHSVDYEADVWLSYGGGYLMLERGAIWNDRFVHCSGPIASRAYADIDIAGGGGSSCPGQRLEINCL